MSGVTPDWFIGSAYCKGPELRKAPTCAMPGFRKIGPANTAQR